MLTFLVVWLMASAVILAVLILLKTNSRLPAPLPAGEIAWLVLAAIAGGLPSAGLLYLLLLWLLIS